QARSLAVAGAARLTSGGGSRTPVAGETRFAFPLRLRIGSRGNVRAGPGTSFAVAFTVDAGAELIGYSHTDEWIRVSDSSGRNGWIFRNLVTRP
ncbi:MAG TPA: SH3 domain-containing protein, partial [Gemmatimonadaceae bacterium]|nr:SH3 domain-containing protein [Gemmatimonadaceae bacterium]